MSTRVLGLLRSREMFPGPLWWLVLSVVLIFGLPAAGADEDTGEELYRRDCASCHGPDGEGSRRGPSFEDAGEADQVYYLHTGRMPILAPEDPISRQPVPYTEDQLAALVDYASGLGTGPDLPTVSVQESDPALGGEAYRLHCAICHGAGGEGGPLTGGGHAPALDRATPTEVVAAITAGPGDMPSFGSNFDTSTIGDVAAYVDHLQEPGSRGVNLPGGRAGEGLVSFAVVALLVVVARRIGNER